MDRDLSSKNDTTDSSALNVESMDIQSGPHNDSNVAEPSVFEEIMSEDSSTDEEDIVEKLLVTASHNVVDNEVENGSPQSSSSTNDGEMDEIILSMIYFNGHLGAAYYDFASMELYVMDDVDDSNYNLDVTKTLYRQCDPQYVLVVSSAPEKFLGVVKDLIMKNQDEMQDNTSTSSRSSRSPVFQVQQYRENTFETCYARVMCLKLINEPKNASVQERTTFLNSVLNFESSSMIYALGLLLRYIDRNWNTITLKAYEEVYYARINYISLKMMKHPTKDVNKLKERHDVIEFFAKNQEVAKNVRSCLTFIQRPSTIIINRYSASQAKISDWQKLYKTISYVISVANLCSRCDNKPVLFETIVSSVTKEMRYIHYFIEYIIDFEGSKVENRVTVKPGVDPKLDELNHQRRILPQIMTEMSRKEFNQLSSIVAACRMMYFPDICFVLAITEWNGEAPDDNEVPGLEFKFTINNIRYYKSAIARELDDNIGDILLKIANQENKVMISLIRFINKYMHSILDAVNLCAELDAILSLYMIAEWADYVRPTMVETQTLIIKGGRHPMLEHNGSFVANDTFSGEGHGRVKILTAPNSSGKTVYLKQIALIVYMAHIGSYVPAESATIGVISHVLSRVSSFQSVVINTSHFMADLRQVNVTLRTSTPNSLIILDEFGQGTHESDGLTLLAAVLKEFIERGSKCPHVFVSTHLHSITQLIPEDPIVEKLVSRSTLRCASDTKQSSGNIKCSFAHSVLEKIVGADSPVVKRSKQVLECAKQGTVPPPDETCAKNILKSIYQLLISPDSEVTKVQIKALVDQGLAMYENEHSNTE
ncbi:mutS protein homolog 5 [Orussus abietinus]|uniref:mutS protein homolog 5 n=1 Tax=Orussus abietinus TaxID=222816 RepID=UPI0006253C8C|nr:mutS protein homolog 5 [Orussus abietinus]